MKRFEEISSVNAVIVYRHKINSLLLIYLVYYMRLMLKNFIVVELLAPCMSSIRATMKNCQTIKR